MDTQQDRHILGLSGGKDSAALAIYMSQHYPELNIEYFFTDTGHELPEVYQFLDKLESSLNINIARLKPEIGEYVEKRNEAHGEDSSKQTTSFKYWHKQNNYFLPSINARWCTINMKIKPFEKWIAHSVNAGVKVTSYVAIRADENREGYKPTNENIKVRFPFAEDGIDNGISNNPYSDIDFTVSHPRAFLSLRYNELEGLVVVFPKDFVPKGTESLGLAPAPSSSLARHPAPPAAAGSPRPGPRAAPRGRRASRTAGRPRSSSFWHPYRPGPASSLLTAGPWPRPSHRPRGSSVIDPKSCRPAPRPCYWEAPRGGSGGRARPVHPDLSKLRPARPVPKRPVPSPRPGPSAVIREAHLVNKRRPTSRPRRCGATPRRRQLGGRSGRWLTSDWSARCTACSSSAFGRCAVSTPSARSCTVFFSAPSRSCIGSTSSAVGGTACTSPCARDSLRWCCCLAHAPSAWRTTSLGLSLTEFHAAS